MSHISWMIGCDGGVEWKRTDFVEHENQLLALAFFPAYFLFNQSTSAALRIARIEYQDDDVALVDHFVQGTDIVAAELLLCLLFGAPREDEGSTEKPSSSTAADVSASAAREESVGSDAICASGSRRGGCSGV